MKNLKKTINTLIVITILVSIPLVYKIIKVIEEYKYYFPESIVLENLQVGDSLKTVVYLEATDTNNQIHYVRESFSYRSRHRRNRIFELEIPTTMNAMDSDSNKVLISSIDEISLKALLVNSPIGIKTSEYIQSKVCPFVFSIIPPGQWRNSDSTQFILYRIEVIENSNHECVIGDTLFKHLSLNEPDLGYSATYIFELNKRNFEYWSGPTLSYSTLLNKAPIWGVFIVENKNPLTLRCKSVLSISEPEMLRRNSLKHNFSGFFNIVIWLLRLFPILFMLYGIRYTKKKGHI